MSDEISDSGEVNQQTLARLIPLTTRRIYDLEGMGLPCRKDGREKLYPVPGAIVWWHEYEMAKVLEKYDVRKEDELKLRELAAKADLKEIDVHERLGNLIPRKVHQAVVQELGHRMRSRVIAIRGWATRFVGLDSPREVEPVLEAATEELLRELQSVTEEPMGALD